MKERPPRKLASILYADVAGYSRLTGEDENATHRTSSTYLDRISTVIEPHRGPWRLPLDQAYFSNATNLSRK